MKGTVDPVDVFMAPDVIPKSTYWPSIYRHSWPIFGPLGPFWWPQKGNFMSKLIPFAPPIVTNPAFWPLKRSSYAQNNQIWSQMSDDAPSGWSPKVQCILGWICDYWGLQRGSVCSWNCPLGASKRDPVVQKWISYASPVMPGQYIDFGIKSGANCTVQLRHPEGQKCP